MALFSRTKNAAPAESPTTATKVVSKALPSDRDVAAVIVRPYITEKAVALGEQRVYVFVVRRDATKYSVREAVKALYNVTPVRVNIVNKAPVHREKGLQRRMVKVAGVKKAYVYLKEGDTITLI